MRFALITLACFVIFALATQTSANRTWNFDADAPNSLPAGFIVYAGKWRVVVDATAPSPKQALMQLAESGGAVFNLALIPATSYADVDISVRMRAVAGTIDQGGGVVWHARDAKNYYVARYNPLEDNFRVYKVIDGRRSQFDTASIPRHAGWYTLRVMMRGSAITCYLDGKQRLKVSDRSLPGPGKIGLWTKADAQTMFDDLTVAAP